MSERFVIYLFRDGHFARAGDTVVCAAPLDLVVSVYGGGGLKGEGGLEAVFGGAAFFRSNDTGLSYLGVWGARNTSRFRTALQNSGAILEIIGEPPPARLIFYSTKAHPRRESRQR